MKKYVTKSILIFLMLALYIPLSVCQDKSYTEILNLLYEKEGEQYFCFQYKDHLNLQEVSRIISIDRMDQSGKVFAYANRKEFSRFLALNIAYEILPHPGDFKGWLNIKDKVNIREIEEWDFYPTYDAYVDMMNQFAADFPSLCQVVSIGNTNDGREILIVKISDNIGIKENEPQFLYTSSIHGDETTGYILMLRLADYLLSNYGSDTRITNMVDNIEIWINPLANPDGTYAGGNSSVSGARRYNANWVDLNRNYPDPEDGPHPDGEEWQTETELFMAMAENNRFVSSANLHGGEEVCNYPWDTWSRLAADDAWWQYVCHEYADTAHLYAPPDYMSDFDNGISNGYEWYSISGGRQDYMNYFHQDREFTLEISDTKLLEPELLPSLWNYNYRSLLNYMEQSMFGLRGIVRDSVTGWPVKAEVYAVLHELDSSWVYSSLPNGNYHRLLYEGTYTMKFSAPGYETQVINNVSVTNRQATILNVDLVPDGVGGIDNHYISNSIFVYPNPLQGTSLYFESEITVNRVTVYDLTGNEVFKYDKVSNKGEISLKSFDAGLYFVMFETKKGTGIKKVLINH